MTLKQQSDIINENFEYLDENKQDNLVSGVNIKTINNRSILGSGNIHIEGGSGVSDYTDLDNLPQINSVTLLGNKTLEELGIQDTIEDLEQIRTNAQTGANLVTQVGTNTTDIGDLKLGKQDITDNNLVTLDKTVVGAVNELSAKIREIELFKSPNVLIQGEPTINNGQVTGFSKTDYLILPFEFNPKDRAFELTDCFRTGTDVTTPQNIFGSKFSIASYISNRKLTVRISSNGTSWDILDLTANLDIQPNTTYYTKLIFNRLNYTVKLSTDGVEYSEIGSVVDTRPPFAGDVYIGIGNNTNNPFLGMINLHKWELKYNNVVFWEGMDDAGLSTRADISLSNLDELGQAKFDAKQDILTAGTGIKIENNVISNTQTSAVWGNIQGTLSNQTDLKTALAGKQATISDIYTIRTNANNSVQYNTVTTKSLYLATHPELGNNSVKLPFINNDIAYLLDKGGTCKFYEDGVLSSTTQLATLFNGKPNYFTSNPQKYSEWVVEVTLDKAYLYTNVVYVDFGSTSWRCGYVKMEYKLSNSTDWTLSQEITNNTYTAVTGAINGDAAGITELRFTFRDVATGDRYNSGFRLAQIGLLNYQSNGAQATLLGLGGGTLYGDVNFAKGGLIDYVKNTDYATASTAGVFKTSVLYGVSVNTSGAINARITTAEAYPSSSTNMFISKGTLENIKEDLVTSVGNTKYQPIGDYATNTKVNEVETTANNAKSIAEGKATGHVFNTKADMESWVQEHSSELKLGDNLYIIALDTPDYWWDGTQPQQLETQKVDLTNYATKTYVQGYHDNTKQDNLTPGANIDISNNTISVTGDLGAKVTFRKWGV